MYGTLLVLGFPLVFVLAGAGVSRFHPGWWKHSLLALVVGGSLLASLFAWIAAAPHFMTQGAAEGGSWALAALAASALCFSAGFGLGRWFSTGMANAICATLLGALFVFAVSAALMLLGFSLACGFRGACL